MSAGRTINVNVSEETLQELEATAGLYGISVSSLLGDLADGWLRRPIMSLVPGHSRFKPVRP